MHFQVPPFEEAKIVSCTKGSIYDVVVDLRSDSPTCYQWVATELSETNFKMMYIPKGCAHGFQTLDDNTIVYYQMTGFFHPECAQGVMWNDLRFAITWPYVKKRIVSDKDRNYEKIKI
jgi:dTDP-4-dehydrorhamnose 3,5-epimerase